MKKIEIIKMDDLDLNNKDFLANKIYSDELHEKIVNYFKSTDEKILYIGVIGNWGSGKSTVVNTAISDLGGNVHLFTYDAWKYEDDGFRRSFIKCMLEQSSINEGTKKYKDIENSLYEDSSVSTNSMLERIKLSKEKDKNYNAPKDYIIATIIVIIFIVAGLFIMQKYENILGSLFTVLGAIGFFNILYSETTYSKSKLFSPEQFYNKFREILIKTKGSKNIIFIDNLDRCDRENMLLTLKCMKSFYLDKTDEKKMKKEKILFIIPFDIDSLKDESTKKQYDIDKIFDDIVYLKNTTTTDRIDFINQLLNEHSDINDIIPPNARDILAKSFIKTPREIIKMINNYVTEYEIISKKNGTIFAENINNREYLMKYVILNRKYPDFISLAYSNMNDFINIELSQYGMDEIAKKYEKECCNFLGKTKSIRPTDYYDFYFNQKQKKYSLPNNIEEAIQTGTYDIIKQSNMKSNIINYYKDSIYFDIENSLWKISIGNKFSTFVILSLDDYFIKEEVSDILSIWNDKIFGDDKFYNEVICRSAEYYDKIILFLEKYKVSSHFSHELFYMFKNGNINMPLLDEMERKELIANLLGKVNFDDFNDDEIQFINTEYCSMFNNLSSTEDKQLFALPYINLTKYISENNLNEFINNLNNQDINIVYSLLNSFEKKKIEILNSTKTSLINYINRYSANISDYSFIEKMIDLIFKFENRDYLEQLNITFNCNEPDKTKFIPIFIDQYIKYNCMTDTFKRFIRKFKKNNNIDDIFKYISNYKPDTKNIYIEEFINYFNDTESEHLTRNFSKIIKFYKNELAKKDIIVCLKNKGLLESFYFGNITSTMRMEIIEITENLLESNDEKIRHLFLYESNLEKFSQFIQGIHSINEMVRIISKCKKDECINEAYNKFIEIIDNNDIINNNDFNYIYDLFEKKLLNKNQDKMILESIIDKTEINNLKRIKDNINIINKKILNKINEKIKSNENETIKEEI